MDGDFDVHQRSEDGCIPPLLVMVRSGGCNTERGTASMEQEVLAYYNVVLVSAVVQLNPASIASTDVLARKVKVRCFLGLSR